jgi:hypothetical protein
MRLSTPARVLLLAWILGLVGTSWATLRINGNQMVEGCNTYGSDVARSRAAGEKLALPHRLVFNIGQGVMGRGELPGPATGEGAVAFVIGLGLMYDIANVAYDAYCPVSITGDANNTGAINSADIIHLVNYVFKSGPHPLPCTASGDTNCSGAVTSADVIGLVNYVFKSGAAPCDVCNLIPGVWSCP